MTPGFGCSARSAASSEIGPIRPQGQAERQQRPRDLREYAEVDGDDGNQKDEADDLYEETADNGSNYDRNFLPKLNNAAHGERSSLRLEVAGSTPGFTTASPSRRRQVRQKSLFELFGEDLV